MDKEYEIDYFNDTSYENERFPSIFEEIVSYTLNNVIIVDRSVYLSVNITTSEAIKELNSHYRNVDRSTDVLSFPNSTKEEIYQKSSDDGFPLVLGDIFICYEVCLKQAEEQQHSLLYEMCFLFSHGLLHLLGIHHDTVEEYDYMREKLQEILTKKGESKDPWNLMNY